MVALWLQWFLLRLTNFIGRDVPEKKSEDIKGKLKKYFID